MIDYGEIKLGKKEAKIDPRTLKLSKYFAPELPPPPASVNWFGSRTNWGMFLNNIVEQLHDCRNNSCHRSLGRECRCSDYVAGF